MIDGHNRCIDYLRISVTDRCNLRCVYCMPPEGVILERHEDIIRFDEIVRIVRLMAQRGLKKIKLTGGEPLLRKNLATLIKDLKEIEGIEEVTLTTNGMLLGGQIEELAKAGLDGVNISLDTTSPKTFQEITRRDGFAQVMESIESVLTYSHIKVKLNCVPLDITREDMIDLVALARKNPIHIRFIEVMPIGYGKEYTYLSEEKILEMIEEVYGKASPYSSRLGNGPAQYYSLDGFCGKIGFISAMSHKFCHTCNRIRLTSKGYLKTCLQYEKGVDLLEVIRKGGTDEEIVALIEKGLQEKPLEHNFGSTNKMDNEEMGYMSSIGG